MRDQLVLGERLRFEWVWEGPAPRDFEVSFQVNSEGELRELIAACGEGEFWRRFQMAESKRLLWASALTEGERSVRVWLHLLGADFAPPEPAPAPVLERMRQEAGLAAIDDALAAADRDRAEPGFGAAFGTADAVALVEHDRLAAADGC